MSNIADHDQILFADFHFIRKTRQSGRLFFHKKAGGLQPKTFEVALSKYKCRPTEELFRFAVTLHPNERSFNHEDPPGR